MEISQNKLVFNCSQHPKYEIIYVQINQILENKTIFYCEQCVSRDLNFKPINYVRIKEIFSYANHLIVNNWPPVDDQQLKQQLFEINDLEKQNQESQFNELNTFFDNMKKQILNIIDEYQKNVIKQAVKLQSINQNIIQGYQQIAQIGTFKSIIENSADNQNDKENQCRYFISEINKQKNEYTSFLKNILREQNKLQDSIRFAKQNFNQTFSQIKNINILPIPQMQQQNNYLVEQQKREQIDIVIPPSPIKQDKNNIIDLLPSLCFINSKQFKDRSDLNIQINRNNNQQLLSNITKGWSNFYYSNIQLQNNKRYIFRFRSNLKQHQQHFDSSIGLGLINYDLKDKLNCYQHQLFCQLSYSSNKTLSLKEKDYITIKDCVKGNFQSLPYETEVQLNVSVDEGILELTDYPNQNHKLKLLDSHQSFLSSSKTYLLSIGLYNAIDILLTTAIQF